MSRAALLRAAVFAFAVGLVALLYWLTLYQPDDPCADQADIGAAVLADEPGDQEALVNRAIIESGECDRSASQRQGED